MKIISLSEGSFVVDKTKNFKSFDKTADHLRDMQIGSLLVEVQPFVVVTAKDILLLDTGLGLKKDGMLQLHKNLLDNGIHPHEVTKVLISHLHKDHCGGISQQNAKTLFYNIAFPRAKYYLQKREYESFCEKGYSLCSERNMDCLRCSQNLVLLEGNGILDDYIKCEVTGGHSLHHQVFWIMDGRKKIFFGGDVAPQFLQMKSRFVAKYDVDGKKSLELRQRWWRMGCEEKWTFLFYHDTETPIYSF